MGRAEGAYGTPITDRSEADAKQAPLNIQERRRLPSSELVIFEISEGQWHDSRLVTVLPEGMLPDTLWVRGSARAHVAYVLDEHAGMIVAMCGD